MKFSKSSSNHLLLNVQTGGKLRREVLRVPTLQIWVAAGVGDVDRQAQLIDLGILFQSMLLHNWAGDRKGVG